MDPIRRQPRPRSSYSATPPRGRPSSPSASRSSAGHNSPPRSPPPATRSHCTATATAATPRQVRDDLRRAQTVIAEATGRYRPPYGIFNAAALALARAHGWEPLLWSKDGRDWQRQATADSITARVTRDLRGGDVILLHDADHYSAPGSWQQTLAALPRILDAIDARRLRREPVAPASPWPTTTPTVSSGDKGGTRSTRSGKVNPAIMNACEELAVAEFDSRRWSRRACSAVPLTDPRERAPCAPRDLASRPRGQAPRRHRRAPERNRLVLKRTRNGVDSLV